MEGAGSFESNLGMGLMQGLNILLLKEEVRYTLLLKEEVLNILPLVEVVPMMELTFLAYLGLFLAEYLAQHFGLQM